MLTLINHAMKASLLTITLLLGHEGASRCWAAPPANGSELYGQFGTNFAEIVLLSPGKQFRHIVFQNGKILADDTGRYTLLNSELELHSFTECIAPRTGLLQPRPTEYTIANFWRSTGKPYTFLKRVPEFHYHLKLLNTATNHPSVSSDIEAWKQWATNDTIKQLVQKRSAPPATR